MIASAPSSSDHRRQRSLPSKSLVRLTKPLELVEGDKRAPEVQEGQVDVVSPLVAHLQAPQPVQPRERPLPPRLHRCRPRRSLDSMPRRAMPRHPAPTANRLAAPLVVVALVRMDLAGTAARTSCAPVPHRRHALEHRPSSIFESCTFDALMTTPSGVPLPSTMMWRLVPLLPRFVGSGPDWAPLFAPPQKQRRPRHDSSQSCPPQPEAPRARGADVPTHRPCASLGAVASTSCRSRNPSPGAGTPTGCRCAARRECP